MWKTPSKHGISYRAPSEVTVNLKVDASALHLHVHNTNHRKEPQAMPPRVHDRPGDSGIGLANTKQRLALLYPNRHTLTIDDTPEYYDVT